MDSFSNCLVVGAGGFLGAVARYLFGLLPLHPQNGFPLATLTVNILGAFTIGLIAAWAAKTSVDPRTVLFLKVGICGGFTTFSSFSLEADSLLRSGKTTLCVAYILLSLLLCLAAVALAQRAVG